jgi:hypothetical protein
MIHTELPIYKTGTELVALSYEVHKQLPRGYKAIGTELIGHCTAMVSLMAMANATKGQERASHAPAPAESTATMTLGQINARLGLTVTADFLADLGFQFRADRASKLYRVSDFEAICNAIAKHVLEMANSELLAA